MAEYFIYILTNKDKVFDGFTKKYNCDRLVYFEIFGNAEAASVREKQIKGWTRAKKDALVATMNPDWNDLSSNWRDIRRRILRP
jgi:putative endonuclease